MKKNSVLVGLALISTFSTSAWANGISMPRSAIRLPMCGGRMGNPLSANRMMGQPNLTNRFSPQMNSTRSAGGLFSRMHPRRAEVIGRDQNLNNSINNNQGHLSGQYNHLEAQNHSIYRQEQTDARQNGGYITKGQQNQLNREENSLNQEVKYDNTNNSFVQNHPLRSQVLSRDANLNYQINKDQGHLGGHYGQLEARDNQIAHQEQMDASRNGGYITQAQQSHLNVEENRLQNHINRDDSGF